MTSTLLLIAQAGSSATQSIGAPPGTGSWLVWGIVLLAVAVAVFLIEVFLPTGGVLGIISGVCAVAGIVCLFRVNTTVGLTAATGSLLALPFLIAFALKVWPETPFAKWITIEDAPNTSADQPARSATADGMGVSVTGRAGVAVGDEGEALTVLRPVGACRIGGQRIDCMARGGQLKAGTRVRVVAVEGGEVWVAAANR